MSVVNDIEDLFDAGLGETWDGNLVGTDPLDFPGYQDAVETARKETGLREGVVTGRAALDGLPIAVIAVDFDFFGGSMGIAVGERIARAFDRAAEERLPTVTLLASGGARLQEGIVSLAQMAKTVAAAERHAEKGLLQVTICRHPTTGGMYASFASLADLIIAEPGATVGFAGPRVAEVVLGRELSRDSHTAENALASGHVDAVAPVAEAMNTISTLLAALRPLPSPVAPYEPVTGPKPDAWSAVLSARDPERPSGADLVRLLMTDFVRFAGDRLGDDDPAIVAGIGRLLGRPITVIAQDRHAGNAGRTRPGGYRLATRVASIAARLGLPVVTFVDTPGADPSEQAERAGISGAIAQTFAVLLTLETPIVSVCIGEGGSGGALALSCADTFLMQERAVFSVIGPEGAAAILLRDTTRAAEMSARLRLTSHDIVHLGIADTVVPDDPEALGRAIASALDSLADADATPTSRLDRWRDAGNRFLA